MSFSEASFRAIPRGGADDAQITLMRQFCQHMRGVEHAHRPYAAASDMRKFISAALSEISHLESDIWQRWSEDLSDWLTSGRRSTKPPPPLTYGLSGRMRIINSKSWNVMNDSPDILDRDGHGTQMAGIISALKPLGGVAAPGMLVDSSVNQGVPVDLVDYLSSFQPNVSGFAPFADLLILKCFDGEDEDSSCVSTLANAANRCIDEKVDLVYVGLVAPRLRYRDTKLLESAFENLVQRGIIVIAPAGNDSDGELRVPAAINGVKAITAVSIDERARFYLSDFSNFIDRTGVPSGVPVGAIQFCALSGEETDEFFTTSLDGGFSRIFGTSVSAAIATGIYASTASRILTKSIVSEYNARVTQSGMIDKDAVRRATTDLKSDPSFIKNVESALLKDAEKSMMHGVLNPTDQFGHGLIKDT
jgi:subtilisin family serine protease